MWRWKPAGILLFLVISCQATAQPVTAWNYHPWPPFLVSKNHGLAWDLVALLNGAAPAGVSLKLESIERKRLNNKLGAGASGVILLANPAWFNDPACQHFLVSPPLLWVRDELITLAGTPINYYSSESLHGKHIGFLQGFKLVGLEEHIRSGSIRRSDSLTSESNLRRLLRGEIDAAIVPRTQMLGLRSLDDRYHVSEIPLHRSTRHLLFTPDLARQFAAVEQIFASASFRLKWEAVLHNHDMAILALQEADLSGDPAAQTCPGSTSPAG